MHRIFRNLLVAFFFFLGIILRLKGLDQQSLWFDELFSILHSSYPSLQSVLDRYLTETNPPFYAIFLHYWILFFGSDVYTIRLASAIFGIFTLCLLFFFYFKSNILNSKVYFFVLIFFSTCLGGIYFAQEARSYSLKIFLSLIFIYQSLTVLLSLIEIKNLSFMKMTLFVITSILLSYTHYFGFLFVGIVWTLLFLYSLLFQFRRNIVYLFIFGNLILISYSYEIIKLLKLKAETIEWIPKPNLLIYLEFINYIFFILKGKYTFPFIILLIVLIILSVWKGKLAPYSRKEKHISLFLVSTITLLILSTFIISQFKPIVTGRNLLILIFPILFLIGIFLSKINYPSQFSIEALVAIISIYLLVIYYKDYQKIHKSDFRQLAIYSNTKENKELPVFSPDNPEYYNYYLLTYYKRSSLVHKMPSINETPLQSFPKEFIILEADLLGQVKESELKEFEKRYNVKKEIYFKARSYRLKLLN
jgi:uncharacterized membrane protein